MGKAGSLSLRPLRFSPLDCPPKPPPPNETLLAHQRHSCVIHLKAGSYLSGVPGAEPWGKQRSLTTWLGMCPYFHHEGTNALSPTDTAALPVPLQPLLKTYAHYILNGPSAHVPPSPALLITTASLTLPSLPLFYPSALRP